MNNFFFLLKMLTMKVEFLDERKRKLGGREGGKKDHVKYP